MKSAIKLNKLAERDNLTTEELDALKGGQSSPASEALCCCTGFFAFIRDKKITQSAEIKR